MTRAVMAPQLAAMAITRPGVAEDEGDTDAGQDAVDGGNHPTDGEDDVQRTWAHAHGLGGRDSGIADGDVGEERKPVGNEATVVAAYLLNRIQVPEVLDTCRDEPDEGEFAENQQCGEYGGGEGNKGGPVWGYETEGDQSAGHGRQVERRPAHHLASGLSSCTLKHEMLGHESGHERLLPIVVHCSSVRPSGRVRRPGSSALPARAAERLAARSLPVRHDQPLASRARAGQTPMRCHTRPERAELRALAGGVQPGTQARHRARFLGGAEVMSSLLWRYG